MRKFVDANTEEEAWDTLFRNVVLEHLEQKLKQEQRATGLHPDGDHCTAQICLTGHVQHMDGSDFDPRVHCTECGAPCLDECPSCKEPIRGGNPYRPTNEYVRPQFCHKCGRAYPWMEERLKTARELLYNDDKLTEDDRIALWDLLKYVMSNPKDDLVPAKKKLIDFRLVNAKDWVREAILDLTAKTIAETMKP